MLTRETEKIVFFFVPTNKYHKVNFYSWIRVLSNGKPVFLNVKCERQTYVELSYTYELSIDIETERRIKNNKIDGNTTTRLFYVEVTRTFLSFIPIGIIIINIRHIGTENEHFQVTNIWHFWNLDGMRKLLASKVLISKRGLRSRWMCTIRRLMF